MSDSRPPSALDRGRGRGAAVFAAVMAGAVGVGVGVAGERTLSDPPTVRTVEVPVEAAAAAPLRMPAVLILGNPATVELDADQSVVTRRWAKGMTSVTDPTRLQCTFNKEPTCQVTGADDVTETAVVEVADEVAGVIRAVFNGKFQVLVGLDCTLKEERDTCQGRGVVAIRADQIPSGSYVWQGVVSNG